MVCKKHAFSPMGGYWLNNAGLSIRGAMLAKAKT